MHFDKETKIYKTFIISISLTIALSLSGVFLGMSIRTRDLMRDELVSRARVDFNNILITREWAAKYGGVYVEKKPGVERNPYLKNPDITTADGRTFTKRNPAMMTREISEMTNERGNYSFHITSLKPLNPNNSPNLFEQEALRLFEGGAKEKYRQETEGDKSYFRYMAPLFVTEECMQCHAGQGYAVGNVRGGISVRFDISDFRNKLRKNTLVIILFALTTTGLTLSLIWFYTGRLIRKVSKAREQIQKQAITDELTELANRRYIIARFEDEYKRSWRLKKSLSCLMLDIDHFKKVNDTYGHQTGDQVLKKTAAILANSVRTYDVAGRFGGEEFLIILPETRSGDAAELAERIRERIKSEIKVKSASAGEITVTVSIGVSELRESDISIDDVIRRADEHLYEAKNTGRDKVCV